MRTKPNRSKYLQELISWKFWLHTAIVDIVLAGIWLGVNKLTTILPIIRDIGFLILLIAGMFCVAWYLPKLAPQYIGNKTKLRTSPAYREPDKLEEGGVLCEDIGRNNYGDIVVNGPLCPKDFAFLGIMHRDKIEIDFDDKTTISNSDYHSQLFCPECKTKYTLGTEPKTIKQSRDAVRSRFEGKRRREHRT